MTSLFRKIFLNERIILGIILLNAIVMFLIAFDELANIFVLEWLDNLFTAFFLLEMVVKVSLYSWRVYIKDRWNVFDAVITLISLPSFLLLIYQNVPDLSYLLVFRVVRVAKFFRFLRFIPHIQEMLSGIQRAFKASLFVFLVLFIYNFIISLLSCFLFKQLVPEYFGNPIDSFYSIFKIFTVEGWYEIPDKIAEKSNFFTGALAKGYFVVIVLTGGIFGFSIVNAIFVDEMVRDNNDALEQKVNELHEKIDKLLQQQQEKP